MHATSINNIILIKAVDKMRKKEYKGSSKYVNSIFLIIIRAIFSTEII